MSVKVGKNCKVANGANQILGIGSWSIAGGATDQLDSSEFGDTWKTFELGMKDGGAVNFSGLYDSADATGQDVLRAAHENDTELTDLRFYVDATSYWRPGTTNPLSHIKILSWEISAAQNGLVQVSFSGKISGKMVRV
jgi:hypothetical protein